MKMFKYSIAIFFISVSLCSNLLAAQSKLLEQSNNLSALEIKQFNHMRAWEFVMMNYIFTEPSVKKAHQELASADNYYSLPTSKRNALKSKFPKIKDLEKLVPQSELKKLSAEIKKLRQEVKLSQEKEKNIDYIKSEVLKYNKNEIELEPIAIDYLLGIDYEETEASIEKSPDHAPELVVGHSKFFTQVGYNVLREIFKRIKINKGDIFYDLGSGYGRASIYAAILYPEATFKGVEYIKERVDETNAVAQKLKLDNVKFYASDILKFDYSDGNIFFIFNPFPPLMPQVLAELHKISKKKHIKIIAMSNTVIELSVVPWLKLVQGVPNHHPNRTPVAIFESVN
jgi:hypothetical protein